MPLTDPAFLATTYIVIDFEALTPMGRPPEPIEVAAIAGHFTDGGLWKEAGRFTSLMRPPDDVPITRLEMTPGLTPELLREAHPQGEVMAELNSRLFRRPCRLVAHSAGTEAALIGGQRNNCPELAATPLLCTVRLARKAWPDLPKHSLNACLRRLRITEPPDRHRALPDVELTVRVLAAVLADGVASSLWATLLDLDMLAGMHVKSEQTDPQVDQPPLF